LGKQAEDHHGMRHHQEPIRTPRLILRQWLPSDLPAYAALNADPEVRRFWPTLLTREQSDEQAEGLQRHIERHGFGFWAVEVPGVAPFVGFTGLIRVAPSMPFAPSVEIGWRLAREHWGKGYATEAAQASLIDGFGRLGLSEIVSYAVLGNAASFRVMERIGMTRDMGGDFDRPLPEESPLRRAAL
jgi:RimJ/RimL family protein N-acetyltransferase